jgi:hypothetical protein
MRIGRGDRSIRRKFAPVPLCLLQIPHDLIRPRTWAAAVGSRWLTAWAMARPQQHTLTKAMGLSPSWEVASCAATQEFPKILWNPKVRYGVQKIPPLVPILRHIGSIQPYPISLRSILLLFTHLRLRLPSGLFPSGFPTKIPYAFLFAPCVLHALLLPSWPADSNYTFEEYKLWSSSLCSFLQPPLTSYLFGPNILLSTLFSNTLNLCSSFNVSDQVNDTYSFLKTRLLTNTVSVKLKPNQSSIEVCEAC